MVTEKTKVKGNWTIRLYGEDGVLKQERKGTNVITTIGKDFLTSFLVSAAAAASTFTMRYVAIGTDNTAEDASDTALGSESARVSGVVSHASDALFRVIGTFGTGVGTGAIVEYALFSVSTASCGTIFNRDVESVINKGASDTLEVTTDITFS